MRPSLVNATLGESKMKKAIITISLLLIASLSYAGTEYVTIIKVMDDYDKGIIERSNGERWLIEKGVGAISFWRFEGKKILIYSPGLFCGVGSKVILPDIGQEARIWSAEQINSGGTATANTSPSFVPSDADLTVLALALLGYFDPEAKENTKNDVVLALKSFQKENGLSQTGKLSSNTQLALSKSVADRKPLTKESLVLASELLDSAKRLMSAPQDSGTIRSNQPSAPNTQEDMIESQIDGDFEGWEGETIVKLMNGQIWQQAEYYYHYHYAFMPKITVIKTGAGYKMIVDGVPKAIGVTRLK
jgi:hypothetical protein